MNTPWTRGDWLQTFSGRRFYPLDPRSEEIEIEDIAHALSLLCRYGGHVDRFYSVAEHCVLMSEVVAPENALAALLHDATEAYVVDVPSPLKRVLPDYQKIEQSVWKAITTRFKVKLELPDEVKEADIRILLNEKREFMSNAEKWLVENEFPPLSLVMRGWQPIEAEIRYLNRFAELFSRK